MLYSIWYTVLCCTLQSQGNFVHFLHLLALFALASYLTHKALVLLSFKRWTIIVERITKDNTHQVLNMCLGHNKCSTNVIVSYYRYYYYCYYVTALCHHHYHHIWVIYAFVCLRIKAFLLSRTQDFGPLSFSGIRKYVSMTF